jgi:ribonuclease HI
VTRVDIFTDGACQGNPGPGGWAAVLVSGTHRREVTGYAPATTTTAWSCKPRSRVCAT